MLMNLWEYTKLDSEFVQVPILAFDLKQTISKRVEWDDVKSSSKIILASCDHKLT